MCSRPSACKTRERTKEEKRMREKRERTRERLREYHMCTKTNTENNWKFTTVLKIFIWVTSCEMTG